MQRLPLLIVALLVASSVVSVPGPGASVAGGHASLASVPGRWVATVLETGSGFWSTSAIAINERGQIVGSGPFRDGPPRGFLWQKGKMTNLGVLAGSDPLGRFYTEPAGINERGQVVGWSQTKTGARHAFLWQNGRIRDLGVLPGDAESEAIAINDRGEIVGTSLAAVAPTKTPAPPPTSRRGSARNFTTSRTARASRAFLWRNGTMTDLGTLGGRSAAPAAINDRGQIVGWAEKKDGLRHAFLWQQGRMRDLGTLPDRRQSAAVALNERGQVIGDSFAAVIADSPTAEETNPRAFLWQSGRLTALATLGSAAGKAAAINNRGQIIGQTLSKGRASETLPRAFVWQNGRATNLAMPRGDTQSAAIALNDRGQIVGWSGVVGAYHAYLWQDGERIALPEPGIGGDAGVGPAAITRDGRIIGTLAQRMDSARAVLWTPSP